jgi:hypothetical protein
MADLTKKNDDLSTKIKGNAKVMLDCEIRKTQNAKTFSMNLVTEKQ